MASGTEGSSPEPQREANAPEAVGTEEGRFVETSWPRPSQPGCGPLPQRLFSSQTNGG